MFDNDWNDFLGYMVYNTPGTGVNDDDEDEDEEEDEDY